MQHEEFKRIMQFFQLSHEEKAEHLGAVFEDSVEFFQRFRHTLEHGTPDEKKQAIEEVVEMQELLQNETKKLSEESGLSAEELDKISQDPANYTPEQWTLINESRQKIENEAAQIANMANFKEQPAPSREVTASEGEVKKKKKKKTWVRS